MADSVNLSASAASAQTANGANLKTGLAQMFKVR